MTARGPRGQESTAGQPATGRRGEVSMQMTASDLISLAVNVANGWSLPDLGLDQTANPQLLEEDAC